MTVADWSFADPESSLVHVRIGRQDIVDVNGQTVASELLFRGRNATDSGLLSTREAGLDLETAKSRQAMSDQATSHVINTTFGELGFARLSQGLPLYLNVTRSFLLGSFPLPFGPENIVLEILEDVHVDDQLVAAVRGLRDRGFRFALDDYIGEPSRAALFPLVDVVKVDVLSPQIDLVALADRLRDHAPNVRILAERVETQQSFDLCQSAGFEFFQGYYFSYPALIQSIRLSPSQVTCVRLLAALSHPNMAVDEIESVVSVDPGLALHVLRTANAAATGVRHHVSSVRQALVLLGPRTLQSWIVLAVVGGGTSRAPQQHLVSILTRAEACGAVARAVNADSDAARTVGLLSGVAQVLRLEAGSMATDARLGGEVIDALTNGDGKLGRVLRAVRAHELDLPDAQILACMDELTLSSTYLQAWASATKAAASLLEG